jgi:2-hydroxychromene-2-carboxylate isomerase
MVMAQTAEFLYDFGSPNAYLVHRAIPQVEARRAVKFSYVPVLLGGIFKAIGNQSPMMAYGHITAKRDYDRLEMQRFIARHGVDRFQMNPHFPVNTLLIMRGAVAAERLGVAEAYNEAMFAGMWEQGLKLDLPEVWHRALIDAELPADALAIKQQLVSNTASAVERGAFGSPTFFLGREMWFGKERLRDVEQAALEGTRI